METAVEKRGGGHLLFIGLRRMRCPLFVAGPVVLIAAAALLGVLAAYLTRLEILSHLYSGSHVAEYWRVYKSIGFGGALLSGILSAHVLLDKWLERNSRALPRNP